jgi:putative phosphonate metabolism protein
MRVAIYFVPSPDHPLSAAALGWFGRDLDPAGEVRNPAIPGFSGAEAEKLIAEPRRYGFHATLKAPFRLAEPFTVADVAAALTEFCAGRPAPTLGEIAPVGIGAFFALVPTTVRPAVEALAADAVRAFEHFRAPLTPKDYARRNPEKLSEGQRMRLRQWGYPYVFDDFRFHMTLTGRVAEVDRNRALAAVHRHFGEALRHPLRLDAVSLVVEPEDGADFSLVARQPLMAANTVPA